MYLKKRVRRKDGKEHTSWSVAESCRVGGRVVQRHVLYLGELSESQCDGWKKRLEVFDERSGEARQMSLFPEGRGGAAHAAPADSEECERVEVRLSGMRLERPRQFGGCWLADTLWKRLGLDGFFEQRLGESRKGTEWERVLRTLVAYRLLAPGSEWRLHRQWFAATAMADILGSDSSVAQQDTLYRCHDLLLEHKEALFRHLHARWADLFDADYEVLLYDLTSTYFECDAPADPADPRRFGYSRDRRRDCVQVVVALIVTPDGLPLAYEMHPGNTSDKTTLGEMMAAIQARYGAARRVWIMDRGIPTEETLQAMRESDPPIHYLVGTSKSRLDEMDAALLAQPWTKIRDQLRVKKLDTDGDTYVLAESAPRAGKEGAMRRRDLRDYIARLKELAAFKRPPKRDKMLLLLGKAQQKAGKLATSLVDVEVTRSGRLRWRLDKERLRLVLRREGRYLLRTNLPDLPGETLWSHYMQLVHVEEAFRTLKGELGLRPVHHRLPERIEAHLFIAFLAYCLQTTLCQLLRSHAGGLTPRSVIEKLSAIQMLDVRIPTADGRELLLRRHTEPDSDQRLLLALLDLQLPAQPPPKIYNPTTEKITT